jgi:hypothetical protein
MIEITTGIDIAAPPERVWSVLTDQEAYSAWNPFIQKMSGELRAGARLDIRIAPPGRRAMRFRPTVLRVEANKELRWVGSLGMRMVFDGEHALLLDSIGVGNTRFRQEERFFGVLAPLIMRGATLESTRRGFLAMNEALKRRAESAR